MIWSVSPNYPKLLDEAESLPDIFEVVKKAVRRVLNRSRGGLMLGLANLGNQPNGFFGGFHYVGSNVIVINRIPLERIRQTDPELYKPYVFHVLLHEYIHTLGFLDEKEVRRIALDISRQLFGDDHLTTQVAADPRQFFPNLAFPYVGWQPDGVGIELVEGFDRSSVSYIG